MEGNVFDDKSSLELDFLESNYYKLPFCDEDVKEFSDLPGRYWDSHNLDLDEYDMQYPNNGLASPLSPSYSLSPSSSSGSSSGQNVPEPSHSLLNERPDTPLMAVKFEDFSNDYGLNDITYPAFPYDTDGDVKSELDSRAVDMATADDLQKYINTDNPFVEDETAYLATGSHRIVDCSLSPVSSPSVDQPPTITILKAQDGSAYVRPAADTPDEPMDFSFSKDQRIATAVSSPVTVQAAASKPSQIFICDPKPSTATTTTTTASASVPKEQKPTVEELLGISDLITLPANQKIKVAMPQAKITTNTFTHRTQIQIPTSALQTILKNGRLVTKLQQDGQILSKIRVMTDNQSEENPLKYMKIAQPSLNLPPTPPSSNSSDTEGSSSPRSHASSSGGPNSPIRQSTHIRVQPCVPSIDAQLLGSTQRLTQSHGPLALTEEEKRTLVAEGYSVPCKFPLTKSEEKSLKKIRRKIKNKISAQESRRKKKEYVETLEKRMDVFNKENLDLKRKLDSLESSNISLLSQLRSLQTLVAGKIPKPARTVTTQTSSCLMMIVLCFAIFLGGWYPFLNPLGSKDLATMTSHCSILDGAQRQSRVLFSIKDDEMMRCREDMTGGCLGYDPTIGDGQAVVDPSSDGGSDTYDEPTGGRVTMNDTGDQTSKIIANPMEPRTAADVIASRKVAVHHSKMEFVIEGEESHDVTKKVVAGAQLVKE